VRVSSPASGSVLDDGGGSGVTRHGNEPRHRRGGQGRGPARDRNDARPSGGGARAAALEVLVRVEGGAFADVLVGEKLDGTPFEPREAAFFTRLVYGTEAWRGRLDWTLSGLARRPLADLAPPVRAALRLGLFQLLLLDRVPAHAAIDTTVALVKQHAGAGPASFANAVLRSFQRRGERPFPDAEQTLDLALAVRWSHPEWLVRMWRSELGDARTEAILAADAEPAPTVLRVDPAVAPRDDVLDRLAGQGIGAHATAYARNGIVLEAPLARITRETGIAVQGEASQLVVDLLDPRAGERVLDVCAAPGGKTAAIAERTAGGLVVAADRSRPGMRRVATLGATRAGRVLPLVADACASPLREGFDAVLVDAPCSGLGTLRAHPEIRWRRTPDDLEKLAARQEAILADAARLVRAGGRLVYATCTIATAENESVTERFLASHPGWRVAGAERFLAGAAATDLVDARGALRTAPDHGGLDGFYAVRLERPR
jgi:16S rRNA (cytosine967-C5)-methyltransferase